MGRGCRGGKLRLELKAIATTELINPIRAFMSRVSFRQARIGREGSERTPRHFEFDAIGFNSFDNAVGDLLVNFFMALSFWNWNWGVEINTPEVSPARVGWATSRREAG
jgi:hypothetical protein